MSKRYDASHQFSRVEATSVIQRILTTVVLSMSVICLAGCDEREPVSDWPSYGYLPEEEERSPTEQAIDETYGSYMLGQALLVALSNGEEMPDIEGFEGGSPLNFVVMGEERAWIQNIVNRARDGNWTVTGEIAVDVIEGSLDEESQTATVRVCRDVSALSAYDAEKTPLSPHEFAPPQPVAPSPAPTEEPVPEPSPAPTEEPVPEPSPAPTEEPVPEPSSSPRSLQEIVEVTAIWSTSSESWLIERSTATGESCTGR